MLLWERPDTSMLKLTPIQESLHKVLHQLHLSSVNNTEMGFKWCLHQILTQEWNSFQTTTGEGVRLVMYSQGSLYKVHTLVQFPLQHWSLGAACHRNITNTMSKLSVILSPMHTAAQHTGRESYAGRILHSQTTWCVHADVQGTGRELLVKLLGFERSYHRVFILFHELD